MDKRATRSTSFRRISSAIIPKLSGCGYHGVYWLLQQSAVRTRKMDETLPGEQIRTRRAISSPLIRFVRPCDNRAFRNSINNMEGNAWNSYAIICYIKTESKQRKKFLVVEKKNKEIRENDLPSRAVRWYARNAIPLHLSVSVLSDSDTNDPDRREKDQHGR